MLLHTIAQASWKQQAAGWFFIIFICGVGFFSFLVTISDVVVGNGTVNLDVQDTAKLKAGRVREEGKD